jgi:hypothetical protein
LHLNEPSADRRVGLARGRQAVDRQQMLGVLRGWLIDLSGLISSPPAVQAVTG